MPTSLHSPHLPALHGERQADVGLQLLFRCKAGHLWPFVLRPVPGGESAGCVRLQLLVLQAVFCLQCLVQQAVCLFTLCLPCPLPSSVLAPVQFALPPFCSFCLPLFIAMCARIALSQGQQFASYETVPLAAATRACSGGPCTGSI